MCTLVLAAAIEDCWTGLENKVHAENRKSVKLEEGKVATDH